MRCQLQAPRLSAKSVGLAIVSASLLPSRLLGVFEPTASAGMIDSAEWVGSVCHARLIQPSPVPVWPGVPSSVYSCASKWLRETTVDRPQACTMAMSCSSQMSRRPDAEGCRPKPEAVPPAVVRGRAP